MRQNLIHPVPFKKIGNMTLFHGPIGKVVGGTDGDLKFLPVKTHYPLSANPTIVKTKAVTMKVSVVEVT